MSKYKYLVLTDLDGTLLHDNEDISKRTLEYISYLKSRGDVMFSFSTGRNWRDAEKIYKKLGLNGFISCNNGAHIYDPIRNISNCVYVPNDFLARLLECPEFFEDFCFGEIDLENQNFSLNKCRSALKEILDNSMKVIAIRCHFEKDFDAGKLNEKIHAKLSLIKSWGFDLSTTIYTHGEYLDLAIEGGLASKDRAAEFLGSFYGVNIGNVLTFGDQMNDLSVACGKTRFVAVKNSENIVKQKSRIVSKYTNNEDCVVREIQSFLEGINQ